MAPKISKTQLSATLVVLLALSGLLPMAHANILVAGGSVTPSAMTPGGTLLASIVGGTITPSGVPDFTATYSTWVYRDPTNFFCSNCLDFVYQFTNNGPAVNERYSMSSFDGFNVSVGMDLLGVHDPVSINRTLLGPGSIVAFNFFPFGDEIVAGETTQLLVIETDAHFFTKGTVSAQNGTAGSNVAFQPSAIPEPGSLILMGGGLLALGGFLRKSLFGK